MKIILIFCVVVSAFAISADATRAVKSYHGYQVLSVEVNSNYELELLKPLLLKNELDFWKLPRLGEKAEIMATIPELTKVRSWLASKNIKSEVIVTDVERLAAEDRNATRLGSTLDMTWDAYYTWETMEPWIQGLESHPNADVTIVGQSSEGRPMYMVKVTNGPSSNGIPKNAIFIDANIHAREWISSAAATYVIHELTTNPDAHADLLDSADLYFIPMANPDGYVHTEVERFWRKTRSVHPDSPDCFGADPNRNFEFMWGGESTSSDPCSDIYTGSAPWSEPEVRAIRDAQHTIRGGGQEIQASISLHSCGNIWLLSWGWTEGVYPEDYEQLLAWGNRVVESIEEVDGTQFETGQGADIFYGVGGASDDYAKSVGIKYATTAELRCSTAPAEIIPTGLEVLAALKETGRTIAADARKSQQDFELFQKWLENGAK